MTCPSTTTRLCERCAGSTSDPEHVGPCGECDGRGSVVVSTYAESKGEQAYESAPKPLDADVTHLYGAPCGFGGPKLSTLEPKEATCPACLTIARVTKELAAERAQANEWLTQLHDARAQLAEAREALEKCKAVLEAFCDEGMVEHANDGCPEDDSCECAIIHDFNAAYEFARAFLARKGGEQ